MASTIAASDRTAHLLSSEIKPKMARADLRKAENVDLRAEAGGCLEIARNALGWNLDELSDAIKRDARQVKRWIVGTERLQLDALMRVPVLFDQFILAQATKSNQIEIETTLRIRRSA